MAEEFIEVVEEDQGTTFQVGGNEYKTLQEAQAALDKMNAAAQERFREAADINRQNKDLLDEIERSRRETEEAQRTRQSNGNGQVPNPAEDPDGWFEYRLQERLGSNLNQMGGMLRSLYSQVQELRAAGSGVNIEKVKADIRQKYAHEPATLAAILASPTAMRAHQQAMEAEEAASDLATLRQQREAKKQKSTTESGAAGTGGSGVRVPTRAEYAAMSDAEKDKFMARMKKDPALGEAFLNQ